MPSKVRSALLISLLAWLALAGWNPVAGGNGVWTTTYPDGASVGPSGLAIDPSSPTTLYLHPNFRGLYRSDDAGASWSPLLDGPSWWFDTKQINLVFTDPVGDLWVSACCGQGLFRSSDAGASWAQAFPGGSSDVIAFAVAPSNPAVRYLGNSGGEIYVSTDTGATWSLADSGLPGDAVNSLEVDPTDPDTAWAGTQSSGVYITTDGGSSWNPANGGSGLSLVLDLLIDPAAPNTIYALNYDGPNLFQTTNGGASWTNLGGGCAYIHPPSGQLIALDPLDSLHLFLACGSEVRESADGGASWGSALVADSDVTSVQFEPGSSTVLYATSRSEGVFKSTDSGVSWGSSHSGVKGLNFPHSRARALHVDSTNPLVIYAGSLRRGYRSLDGGASWADMAHPGGQMGTFATTGADPGVVWAAANDLWRSGDSGATWADGSNGAFCCFQELDVAVHPGDPLTLYVGGYGSGSAADGVYRTTDGGTSWTPMNSGLTDPRVRLLAVDPNDGTTLYAGVPDDGGGNGAIFKTIDGGANWFQLGGGLPGDFQPNQIVVHPLDSNLVHLVAEGNQAGLYRSQDGGASWTYLFPENANAVAIDPGDPNRLYFGTWNTSGFWRSLDAGASWTLVNEGLPINPGIEAIVVDPANPDRILLGTVAGVSENDLGAGTVELTVTTNADAGPGSLRDALVQANQDGAPNRIRFEAGLMGSSITLTSPLPGLDGGVDLDGDVDGDCNPDIAIDGQWMPNANGLVLSGDANRVAGLAIHSFDCPGCGGDLIVVGFTAQPSNNNLIECNSLGTDLSGIPGLGTQTFAVKVYGGSTGNLIRDNRIVFNGTGIQFLQGSSDNVVGPGNEIAFSLGAAVEVVDAPSLRNTITENSLHDNGGLAIDLGGDGVTPNDGGDSDSGPNDLLNYPVITTVTDNGASNFTVDGTAAPLSTVELFAVGRDPSGFGEADQFLASVAADGAGLFSYTFDRPAGLFWVAATTTDAAGNTSELSQAELLETNDITVDSPGDSGAGSLRDALDTANSDGAPTVISFDVAMAGQTIFLLSPLPPLTEDQTTIDADLGGDCTPDVGLDGTLTGGGQGIEIQSSDNLVRGLIVGNFLAGGGVGVQIRADSIPRPVERNVVECTYVGTDASGTAAAPNEWGISVEGGANDNRVGPGNVVAFNQRAGLRVWDGFQGNAYPTFTGLAADAIQVFPVLQFDDTDDGFFSSSDGITPTDGSGAPFNEHFGMRLSGTVTLGAAGDYTFTLPTIDDRARLLVDGGFVLDDTSCCPASATLSLGAGPHSLEVDFEEGCGAAGLEVQISGPGSVVLSTDGAVGGACGGGQPGLCGELFQLRVPTEDNTITQSSFFDNGSLGISLNTCDSPTINDPGDLDLGGNRWLNYPELTSFVDNGGGNFDLTGTAAPNALVEIYGARPDPSGFGEGKAYLDTVPADGLGDWNASVALPPDLFDITTTATDAAGNTSEFSATQGVKTRDAVTLGNPSGFQGDTVDVPIFVRDLAATPLGLDQPVGDRIQAFTVQVQFSPAAGVTGVNGVKAGIASGLTPVIQLTQVAGDTATYIVAYDEGTDLVPFTLDGASPGDHVADLQVTLSPTAQTGNLAVSLLASGTVLANQGGTLEETQPGGSLDLFDGSITVRTRAATGLVSFGVSASAVQLQWTDPGADETGFRVERSLDGVSGWSPVGTVGPDTTAFTDGGLAAATLYYHRVISFSGGGDNAPSNLAAASTFPASPANVCVEQASDSRSWGRFASVARSDSQWATVYQERTSGTNDEIYLRFLNEADATPAGVPVLVSATDSQSWYPNIRWNGSRLGVSWIENLVAADGTLAWNEFFTLLTSTGQPVRRGVRLEDVHRHQGNKDEDDALVWDGGGWGYFDNRRGPADNEPHLTFWRFDETGELLTGPVVLSAAGDFEHEASAAWNGAEYGVAWQRSTGGNQEVLFRRLLSDGTDPVGSPGEVQIFQGPDRDIYGTHVLWDGTGWVVTWSVFAGDFSELAVYLRRLAADGTPVGGVNRVSELVDSAGGSFVDDELPKLFLQNDGDGGFVCIATSYTDSSESQEISRFVLDAVGNRVGSRLMLTAPDGSHAYYPRAATDGTRYVTVFNDNGPGAHEVASLLVDTDGSPLAGPNPLTGSGSPGNHIFLPWPVEPLLAPYRGGFLGLWVDSIQDGTYRLHGAAWDAGGRYASYAPLSGRDVRGGGNLFSRPALAAVGEEFAVAWEDSTETVVFQRFALDGTPVTGEVEVATGVGFRGGVALAYSGERYGVAWIETNDVRFQALEADGTLSGPVVTVTTGNARNSYLEMAWVGNGWALVWRGPGAVLFFARVDPFGAVAIPATPLTGAANARFDLLWSGQHLGLVWTEDQGAGPPGAEAYFAVIDLDGNKTTADVVLSNDVFVSVPRLYWRNDRFHVVRRSSVPGNIALLEDEVLPDGTWLPQGRQLANRGSSSSLAVAHDGTTSGILWAQLDELFFETGACLADATPPACPALSIGFDDVDVQLSWPAGADPESGIWRHELYRDGILLAELDPTTTAVSDGGWRPSFVHSYELRAVNGAFQSSTGCTVHPWSTVVGDANGNGDGSTDVADIFYLINFLFSGGAAPRGDADANGDGVVSVLDIFYLVNFYFAGGPPPAPVGVSPPTEVGDGPSDEMRLGSRLLEPSPSVVIPITVRDLASTPLDEGQGPDGEIQGFSFRVDFAPTGVVSSVSFTQAGVTAGLAPVFPIVQVFPDHVVVLLSFDEATAPLGFTLNPAGPGDLVGELTFDLAPTAVPGTVIQLDLEAATAALVNDSATVSETEALGTLRTHDGQIRIELGILFVDGFETGDTSAW